MFDYSSFSCCAKFVKKRRSMKCAGIVEDSVVAVLCFCTCVDVATLPVDAVDVSAVGVGVFAVEVVVVRSSGHLQLLLVHCFCNTCCCNSSTIFAVFEFLTKPSQTVP